MRFFHPCVPIDGSGPSAQVPCLPGPMMLCASSGSNMRSYNISWSRGNFSQFWLSKKAFCGCVIYVGQYEFVAVVVSPNVFVSLRADAAHGFIRGVIGYF